MAKSMVCGKITMTMSKWRESLTAWLQTVTMALSWHPYPHCSVFGFGEKYLVDRLSLTAASSSVRLRVCLSSIVSVRLSLPHFLPSFITEEHSTHSMTCRRASCSNFGQNSFRAVRKRWWGRSKGSNRENQQRAALIVLQTLVQKEKKTERWSAPIAIASVIMTTLARAPGLFRKENRGCSWPQADSAV